MSRVYFNREDMDIYKDRLFPASGDIDYNI